MSVRWTAENSGNTTVRRGLAVAGCTGLLAFGLVGLAPAQADSGNLAPNGGFDNNVDGWRGAGASAALTHVAPSNGGFLELANNSGSTRWARVNDKPNSVVDTTAGEYTVTAQVRTKVSGQEVRLRVQEYAGKSRIGRTTAKATPSANEWHTVTVKHTAKGGSDLDINVLAVDLPNGSSIDVDDISVVGPNADSSSDFTSSATGWITDSKTILNHFPITTEDPFAHLTNSGSSQGHVTMTDSVNSINPVEVGATYQATAQLRGDVGVTGVIRLEEWKRVNGKSVRFGSEYQRVELTDQWQTVTTSLEATEDGAYIDLSFVARDAAPGQGMDIDNVQLVRSQAPNVAPTAVADVTTNDLDLSADATNSTDTDGTITNYTWDFGDGTTNNGANTTHTYNQPGNYTVTLTVTDNRGGTHTTTTEVTAIAPNVAPTAVADVTTNDLDLSADATNSTDTDGTITNYTWDFGDGTTNNGANTTHTYNQPGNYTVTLTVTDNRGGTHTTTTEVTAIAPNVAPTAVADVTTNDLDLSADATNSTDTDGTITNYTWDFGDGTTNNGANTTHTYNQPGNYTVTLTVTDNRGGTHTTTTEVTAIAPNVAPTAVADVTTNDLDLSADATNSTDTDGTITNYTWDFGDGTTNNGANTTHTYNQPGNYTVTLTVTDNRGGTHTTTTEVTAIAPGPAAPNADTTGVPAGVTLTTHHGNIYVNDDGAVIDGLDLHGYLTIKAKNVTVKNSIIRGGSSAPTSNKVLIKVNDAKAANVTIKDTTILPTVPSPYHAAGIRMAKSGSIERVDISGTVDGMIIHGNDISVTDSFLHDFATFASDPNQGGGASHSDGIQVQSGDNVHMLGNTVEGADNAALQVTQDAGTVSNLSFNNNWVNHGGCSVNIAKKWRPNMVGLQVNDNRFGRDQANTDCAIIFNAAHSDLQPTGNVWADNGQSAGIKKGA